MATPLTPAQVEQLKRLAKKLAREQSIPLHEAQRRLAAENGYENWSLLHKRSVSTHKGVLLVRAVPLAASETPELPVIVTGGLNREYLHGDQHEVHLNRFFCRSCDEFVAPEHFFEHHDRQETLGRALDALTLWHLPSNENAEMRPDNAHNILEDDARREEIAFQHSRGAFHRWLERHKGKRSRIGDLAVDVLGDKKFPVAVKSVEEAVSYLHSRFASDGAVKAMQQAWRQFETVKSA
ncbi:hypothetical protein F3J24_03905 [Comamonas sp. Tr-654]|uniref:YozE family protein n=1 Tax=Comamonas sp. Tr-654 TaxID=2608341 RepID=UPI001421E151|nr:YozE family protein [Comamonas sp. Tr-654]NIF82653.1 hypothetical protein [Comamonas sp. Tr-654]